MVYNKLYPYYVRLTLEHPFVLPTVLLENVSLDTDSNSSFINKCIDKDHVRKINIWFDSLADMIFINGRKYRCIWDEAVIKYEDENGAINSKFVEPSVRIFNEKTFNYINMAKQLYIDFNKIKQGQGSFNELSPLKSILVVSSIGGVPCVLEPVGVINRGQSILDVISMDDINQYAYKRYINSKSLNNIKNEPNLLLALKPKKKKSAKSILITRKLSDIITILPIIDEVTLSIV